MTTEQHLKDLVLRHFISAYPNLRRLIYDEAIHATWKRADILFIEGRSDRVHVVEAEPTIDRCFNRKHGFAQVCRLKGNYRWIVVPLSEFNRDHHAFRKAWRTTGVGVMVAYGERKHGGIREILQPVFVRGSFLHLYREADDSWSGQHQVG
jgi:hypothetical protein